LVSKKEKMDSLIKTIIIKVLIFVIFLFFALPVYAANLYIRPSGTSASVGNIVSVQILVDTSSKVINNAESTILFPKDLLEVISIDNKSSIFSLWVEEPSFSNISGQIVFNGGVPNPGFQGNSGKIISITFRAKNPGTASLVFSDSAVRENDGLGTDILINKVGSEISILGNANNQTPPEEIVFDNPAPIVTSSSHPKQDSWYSKSDIDLAWQLPSGTQAVKTLLGSYPNSEPTVYYSKPITEKNIKNIDDGVLYFHVNYLANGSWSKVAHYKLQIDTVNPTNLTITSSKDDVGKVSLQMKAEDALSGLDYFKVLVDNEEPFTVKADTSGGALSILPIASAGDHKVIVTAYDKAGNYIDKEIDITTDYIAKLSIDSYPSKIKVNESIEIKGTAPYPLAPLSVSIKNSNNVIETYKIKSDSYSNFRFVSKLMEKEGEYLLWVDLLKDSGEISISSEKVKIIIEKPIILQIGSYTTELLSVLVPAIILIIVLLFILYYGWYKFFALRHRMRKDFKQIEERIHNSFNVLYIEATKQLEILEKSKHRKLSESEEKAKSELKDAIKQMDEYIEKHIRKIEDNDL
jgi:hypothetical protein